MDVDLVFKSLFGGKELVDTLGLSALAGATVWYGSLFAEKCFRKGDSVILGVWARLRGYSLLGDGLFTKEEGRKKIDIPELVISGGSCFSLLLPVTYFSVKHPIATSAGVLGVAIFKALTNKEGYR